MAQKFRVIYIALHNKKMLIWTQYCHDQLLIYGRNTQEVSWLYLDFFNIVLLFLAEFFNMNLKLRSSSNVLLFIAQENVT